MSLSRILTRAFALPILLSSLTIAQGQDPSQPAPTPLTDRFATLLQRSSDGRSPTNEDIRALANATDAITLADLKQALPLILKALDNPDVPVRTYALTTLVTLQEIQTASPPAAPETAPAQPSDLNDPNAPNQPQGIPPPPTGPTTFKPDAQKLLTPAIQQIAAHLTEEVQSNRLLTATILGGFIPNPPASIFPALLAYLKRDDAVGPVGLAVTQDLLQLAPVAPGTASAIATYLRRSDQTADSRANLIDTISSAPNQSQSVNKTVLTFLDSDDPSLRARVILSLPALDLASDVFADTRSRVAALVTNDQENLQVINAAKAVSPCWTAVKMSTGCPVYQ